jgi:hypothetical protein
VKVSHGSALALMKDQSVVHRLDGSAFRRHPLDVFQELEAHFVFEFLQMEPEVGGVMGEPFTFRHLVVVQDLNAFW